MEVITIDWLYPILSLVIGLVVGAVCIIAYFRSGLSKEQQNLLEKKHETELECEYLLEEAKKSGESRKRELVLQAKEEIHRSKLKLERDIKEKREGFVRERQRLDQREENLESKLKSCEEREGNISKRDQDLSQREEAIAHLEEERIAALEKVSSLSMEDARKQILQLAEDTYRKDTAQRLRRIEEEYKEEAQTMARQVIANAIQRYASDYVSELTVSVVSLPNDEMKG
ncbi:MAG: Rnase Y domain-containing protein, partial [Eubacteriales bacterium]|nr:Rnase Y domain-containing protein [Eubacteriales bacterium]